MMHFVPMTKAASGACGNGMILANQNVDSVAVTLKTEGVVGDIVVRLTDGLRTDAVIMTIPAEKAKEIKLMLPAVSFMYIGTDLPDPIPTYDVNCYRGISTVAPTDDEETQSKVCAETLERKELDLG